AEMQRSETCDEYETELSASALQEFMEKFPASGPTILDYFMQQSPTRLLLLLSTMRPGWSNLIDLRDGTGFIGALQDEWNEAKSDGDELFGKPEESNGLHVDSPN